MGRNGKLQFRGANLRVCSTLHKMDIAVGPNSEKAKIYDFYFGRHRHMKLDVNDPHHPTYKVSDVFAQVSTMSAVYTLLLK